MCALGSMKGTWGVYVAFRVQGFWFPRIRGIRLCPYSEDFWRVFAGS